MRGLNKRSPAVAGPGTLNERFGGKAQVQYSATNACDTIAAARCYAERYGIPVFPVHGKLPAIKEWQNRATTEPETISAWWSRWPNAGIAVMTGHAAGLLILDLDGPQAITHARECGMPATPVSRTKRGFHVWLAFPAGFEHSTTRANVLVVPGGDTRGEGGFIVAPPSPHPEGGRYEWVRPPKACPFAPCPDWLLDALTPSEPVRPARPTPEVRNQDRYAEAALRDECDEVAATCQGGRNHRLNVAAFKLARFVAASSLAEDEVVSALSDAASRAGLGIVETRRTISSGLRAGKIREAV